MAAANQLSRIYNIQRSDQSVLKPMWLGLLALSNSNMIHRVYVYLPPSSSFQIPTIPLSIHLAYGAELNAFSCLSLAKLRRTALGRT